jgi:hypothetical protein
MPHPLLPRLKTVNRGSKPPAEAAIWESRTAVELDKISKDLDVAAGVEMQINSIPDLWARATLFEMGLFETARIAADETSAFARGILGEWRGLLAMLALKEYLNLTELTQRPVRLPSNPAIGRNAGFLDVAAQLAPGGALAKEKGGPEPWLELNVLLYGGQPIGITSPSTLVCTATDCSDAVGTSGQVKVPRINKERVPWFDGLVLRDPRGYIAPWEKRALAVWLNELQTNLLNHPGWSGDSNCTDFATLINRYKADLGGSVGEVTYFSMGLGFGSGIFTCIPNPVQELREPVPPVSSAVRLIPSTSRTPDVDVLVIDRSIADQWKIRPEEIRVSSNIPLSLASRGESLKGPRTAIAGKPLGNNTEWRVEEDFFTDKLIAVVQEQAFPGTLASKGDDSLFYLKKERVSPIPPVPVALLDHLTPTDIAQHLQFTAGPNDSIIVRLTLNLSGPDGRGREFTMTHPYESNDIVVVTDVPILEIWPNFVTERETQARVGVSAGAAPAPGQPAPTPAESKPWSVYYTYYSFVGKKCFYAKPFLPGEPAVPKQNKNDLDGSEFAITLTRNFPEAMVCSATAEGAPLGILLLKPPVLVKSFGKSWKVGVDFGTTGTNVYAGEAGANPQPMTFQHRFATVTAAGQQRSRMDTSFLFSDQERKGVSTRNMLSLYHHLVHQPTRLEPLLDGHIFFFRVAQDVDASAGSMESNMKWGEKVERIRAEAFLEQVCVQCAAEARCKGADSISWRFSFPSVFSDDDLDEFNKIWEKIVKACTNNTGVTATNIKDPRSESVAAAIYFARLPGVAISPGAICIDIGGGTSDVAIWQGHDGKSALKLQTSLRLAGRDMFLAPLSPVPSFFKALGVNETIIKRLDQAANTPKAFYAQADALLSCEGDRMLSILPTAVGEPIVREFLQLLELGLSGVFYYVGSLLFYLVKRGRYVQGRTKVSVGGNGAKMLHWCAKGSFSGKSPVAGRFKAILEKSSGFPPNSFDIIISSDPKCEVAYGLVVDDIPLEDSDREEEVVAGETFVVDGDSHAWDELIDTQVLKRGLRPKSERLEAFLKLADPSEARDENLLADIPGIVRDELINSTLADEKYLHIEPIFIIELREYLKHAARAWAARHQGRATAGRV